ncbi:MAG: DUF134 domain-containing protein [Candidatus Methanosuratus sp.]|nr:DUF134 domain-containing protein [Candidatus Methanosuratincola sp.]
MSRGFCKRCRRGCVGRIPKNVNISKVPVAEALVPFPVERAPPIELDLAELEAMRLVELEKLSYDEAGMVMGISRNTIWRLVESGKEKMISAFFEGRKVELHRVAPLDHSPSSGRSSQRVSKERDPEDGTVDRED